MPDAIGHRLRRQERLQGRIGPKIEVALRWRQTHGVDTIRPGPRPGAQQAGVLAPNAKLRSLVVPQGPPKDEEVPGVAASGVQCEAQTAQVGPGRISWARLLKRVFDIDLQRCPHCGAGELKIIAAVLERPVIEKILAHLGLDPQPPPKGRVREAGLHYAA
jgi:hypothetical protein